MTEAEDKKGKGATQTEFMVLKHVSLPGSDSGAWAEVGTINSYNADKACKELAAVFANSDDEKERAKASGTFKAVANRSWKNEPVELKPRITF